MSNFSLYEINEFLQDAINARFAQAESNDGVYDEDFDTFIDEIEMERSKKLLDCARYVKSLKAQAEAVKAEKQALANRQSRLDALVERLQNYISKSMSPEEQIQDANTRLSWRKSTSIEITDIEKLPVSVIKLEKVADKSLIKKILSSGDTVDGAHLVEKMNLQIK